MNNNDSNYIYPLEVGYSWDYSRSFDYTITSGDTGAINSIQQFTPSSVNVIVDRREMLSGKNTYVLHTTNNEDPLFSENYYVNNEEGLFLVAYRNAAAAAVAIPKKAQEVFIKFNNKSYDNFEQLYKDYQVDEYQVIADVDDSLFIEQNPVRAIRYPLQVGEVWNNR